MVATTEQSLAVIGSFEIPSLNKAEAKLALEQAKRQSPSSPIQSPPPEKDDPGREQGGNQPH